MKRLIDISVLVAITGIIIAVFAIVVTGMSGCGGEMPDYIDVNGVSVYGESEWITQADTETQETEAAAAVSDTTKADPAKLLRSLDGVQVHVRSKIASCGTVQSVDGCTTISTVPGSRPEIEIEQAGPCSYYLASLRHELAHVMVNAVAGNPDTSHSRVEMWDRLNRAPRSCSIVTK